MYENFLVWANRRENLNFVDSDFWAWDEAFNKAKELLNGIESYTSSKQYELLLFNAALHYCITTDFTCEVEIKEGDDIRLEPLQNPLYLKYNIQENAVSFVSSASDESSSASYHITKSMQEADFLTQDLMMTPYGRYVYQILEQLSVNVVLL